MVPRMFRASLVVWCLAAGVLAPAEVTAKPKIAAKSAKDTTKTKTTTSKKSTTAKSTSATKPTATKAATSPKKSTTSASDKKKTASKSAKPARKTVAKADTKKTTTKKKHESRVPTKSTGSNMPAGWAWPPNKTMVASGKACLQKLDELNVSYKKVEREGRIVEPITSDGMTFGGVRYVPVYGTGPRKLDCHLAVALATFGKDLASVGVRTVHFGSLYRWSKVRVGGLTKNILSRHALGLAMDITAFTDDQGRTAYVARDYQKDDALLLAIEKAVNTSGKFRLLLTPKNDPASHKDHFHLEANPNFASFGAHEHRSETDTH